MSRRGPKTRPGESRPGNHSINQSSSPISPNDSCQNHAANSKDGPRICTPGTLLSHPTYPSIFTLPPTSLLPPNPLHLSFYIINTLVSSSFLSPTLHSLGSLPLSLSLSPSLNRFANTVLSSSLSPAPRDPDRFYLFLIYFYKNTSWCPCISCHVCIMQRSLLIKRKALNKHLYCHHLGR